MLSSPSGQAVDAAGVSNFIDAVQADHRIEPHGLIIQRHGHRIAEGYWAPHDRGRARLVYSLSKSFTGAALGLQIAEGRLTLDDLVSDHLPELEFHNDARRLRVRHIASMATGHAEETFGPAIDADPGHPVQGFLSLPAPHLPGTVFAYNQPPVLTLALILERLAGQRLSEYLSARLLEPLGVNTFEWARWPGLTDMGFSGVFTDLDAIAKLGQLHLDNGRFGTQEILPASWVSKASTTQTTNPGGETIDWQQGYGFQLWQSQHGYRGDGAFGQFMVVLPEYDTVVAMFSNTNHMQEILDLMWQHLLPAINCPGSPAADTKLADQLDRLTLAPACDRLSTTLGSMPPDDVFAPSPPTATSHRSITSIELKNDRLVINEDGTGLTVALTAAWTIEGNLATSAAQLDDGSLVVDVIFLNTPHRLELTLANGEFRSDWGRLPLFGAGIGTQLSALAHA